MAPVAAGFYVHRGWHLEGCMCRHTRCMRGDKIQECDWGERKEPTQPVQRSASSSSSGHHIPSLLVMTHQWPPDWSRRRFTVLRQEKPTGQGQSVAGLEERRQQAQASRKNQRLAAQMERRPAVVAALKLKKVSIIPELINFKYFCGYQKYLLSQCVHIEKTFKSRK